MNVSRIDAISPRQVDWRKLTAQEIIKYEEQGVEVPSQYLQWAQQFVNEITSSDNDEITYEAANSQTSAETPKTESVSVDSESDENSEVQEEPKTPAQAKRQALEENGTSLSALASLFIGDSNVAKNQTIESSAIISSSAKLSDSEIQALDTHMKELLAKVETKKSELLNEVNLVNGGDNNSNSISKINRLNAELKRLGLEGQSSIASTEGDLNVYGATISAQTDSIFNSNDFGAETIGIGSDLLASISNLSLLHFKEYILGQKAVKTGEKTVDVSEATAEIQSEALNKNRDNLAKAQSYKNQVQSSTGVSELDVKNDKNRNEDDPANSKHQIDKISGADLEQILKLKIKKGENIENNQLS